MEATKILLQSLCDLLASAGNWLTPELLNARRAFIEKCFGKPRGLKFALENLSE
jgi:hypothetical protein